MLIADDSKAFFVPLVLSLLLGLAAAGARVVYVFFPLFNLVDVIVFGTLGFALRSIFPARWGLWLMVAGAPVLAAIATIVVRMEGARLAEGVGVGHVVALFLVPAALLAGALLARRHERLREGASASETPRRG